MGSNSAQLSTWLAGTDALIELDGAHDAAWTTTDSELLALCRDRLAMLLGHESTLESLSTDRRAVLAGWPTSPAIGARERAALEFTEQYAVDVASMTDDQAAALRIHLGDRGLANFVTALLVVEQRMTLEIGLAAVLGSPPPTATDAALEVGG